MRALVAPPEHMLFQLTGDFGGPPAISPDGRSLVFAAVDSLGTRLLWIRHLDAITPEPLTGSDDATFPFWSPDGRSCGVLRQRQAEAAGSRRWLLADALRGARRPGRILERAERHRVLARRARRLATGHRERRIADRNHLHRGHALHKPPLAADPARRTAFHLSRDRDAETRRARPERDLHRHAQLATGAAAGDAQPQPGRIRGGPVVLPARPRRSGRSRSGPRADDSTARRRPWRATCSTTRRSGAASSRSTRPARSSTRPGSRARRSLRTIATATTWAPSARTGSSST